MSRNAHCGSTKTYATCFAMEENLIRTSSSLKPGRSGKQQQQQQQSRWTYPVSLAVEQRRGLVEHLLEGLLLGDALGESRSVGVDLGLTAGVSEDARSVV